MQEASSLLLMCYGRDCLRKRERFPVNFPLMQFSNPFTLQRYKPDLFQESGLGETRVMDHFAELMKVLVSGPALKMRKSQCSEALRECNVLLRIGNPVHQWRRLV